jgi:DNA-binding winged helix-turn-helix (wHTH) protein
MDTHDPEQPAEKSNGPAKKAGEEGTAVSEQSPHIYEFNDFRLDTKNTTNLKLLRNGLPFTITPTQFRLLCLLVENRERDLSTNELISRVWAGNVIDESNQKEYADNLHHQIQFLRDKIGKDNIPHKRKAGYSFKPEVKVIPTPPKPPDYRDFQFAQWVLYSRECLWVKIFLGLGVALSLTYLIAYMMSDPLAPTDRLDLWDDPATVLCLIQFVVVFGALAASASVFDRSLKEFPRDPVANAALMTSCGYTDPKKWADAKASAESSRARYSRYWKFLLFAWTGLYLLLTLALRSKWPYELGRLGHYMIAVDPSHPYWWLSISSTVFNNFNSLAIALCFLVLNLPTVFREEEPETSLNRLAGRMIFWGLLAIAAIALAEAVLIYYPRLAKDDYVWFEWMTRTNVVWATNLLSGVVGSITLALFVGRIQSKFLGASTWLPLAFYLYVAIQSLYVTLLEGAAWGAAIIEAALILKCLLYLYVAWLFKSGRLLYYLVRVKTIYVRVNIEWQDFILNLNRGR